MSLLQMIQEEHSKAQCDNIVRYIGNDKKRFAALMTIFLQGEYRDVQRAAWPLSYCVQNHPQLVTPYFRQLLNMLEKPGTHNAVQRNITRLLQDVSIPKRYQGKVMDSCFRFIESHDTPVAIKAFSLTILEQLSKDYPEILPEIKLLIEERWEHETAAFRSRARKILKKLNGSRKSEV
jgi:hypothetical protein